MTLVSLKKSTLYATSLPPQFASYASASGDHQLKTISTHLSCFGGCAIFRGGEFIRADLFILRTPERNASIRERAFIRGGAPVRENTVIGVVPSEL